MEKEKFAKVFASVPEEIEEERQIVGTAGRRLLSDLCFLLKLRSDFVLLNFSHHNYVF